MTVTLVVGNNGAAKHCGCTVLAPKHDGSAAPKTDGGSRDPTRQNQLKWVAQSPEQLCNEFGPSGPLIPGRARQPGLLAPKPAATSSPEQRASWS